MVTLVARPLLTPVKSCTGENTVYSQAEHVFILKHYFSTKSYAAVREVFSNAYPDKEVPNETIHQMVTKYQDTRSIWVSWRKWWAFAVKIF
jgi:hypothetical protein